MHNKITHMRTLHAVIMVYMQSKSASTCAHIVVLDVAKLATSRFKISVHILQYNSSMLSVVILYVHFLDFLVGLGLDMEIGSVCMYNQSACCLFIKGVSLALISE